jgi:hypothetical protein
LAAESSTRQLKLALRHPASPLPSSSRAIQVMSHLRPVDPAKALREFVI